MTIIQARNLGKTYKTQQLEKGLIGIVKGLFVRKTKEHHALVDVSFDIEKGDIVGYLGPNGAGKSTTLKILSGIMTPTIGDVLVNGIRPYDNRKANAKQIGVVFGHKTQLWWDLPAIDSLRLMKDMYQVDEASFNKNLNDFVDILDLKSFVDKPVRQLSLGQRMRVEIAASLLHNPDIIFLDEPTIGLDVIAKQKIRDFILKVNKERNITVILTTHDMGDISSLCNKIILIDDGQIKFNGNTKEFEQRYGNNVVLECMIKSTDQLNNLNLEIGEIIKQEDNKIMIKFNKEESSLIEILPHITSQIEIEDLTIHQDDIESIVKRIFK
jgi:ABC-2 type transport system ATP-binding protein